jgi:predicted transposase/invertase (TIGR01784 family)
MKKKKYTITQKATTNKTAKQPIRKKHDKGYKRILLRKRNFLHFLKKYIGADWTASIDEKDLVLISNTMIDEEHQNEESDVIYKLRFKDREIIFYVLLEMQSRVDKTMPFRLLKYMVELMKREFENTPENERTLADYRLTPVIPVIVYNGVDNWTVSRNFKEYLQGYEQFGEYIIDFKYFLFDLNREGDETLVSTNELLDIVFMMDKTLNRERIKESLDIAFKGYRTMGKSDQQDMKRWINDIYLSHVGDKSVRAGLLKNFEKGDVSNMIYGIEMWVEEERQKGEAKGKAEGIAEGKAEAEKKAYAEKIKMVKNLIRLGLSNAQISEATDFTISEDEIERLRADN